MEDTAIGLGYLDTHPHAIAPFGPLPTALSPEQVARLAELLGQIDLPAGTTEAASVIGCGADKIVGGSRKYLVGHFSALREFYVEAALRHLHVVLWWD
jgi:hypothetical protein